MAELNVTTSEDGYINYAVADDPTPWLKDTTTTSVAVFTTSSADSHAVRYYAFFPPFTAPTASAIVAVYLNFYVSAFTLDGAETFLIGCSPGGLAGSTLDVNQADGGDWDLAYTELIDGNFHPVLGWNSVRVGNSLLSASITTNVVIMMTAIEATSAVMHIGTSEGGFGAFLEVVYGAAPMSLTGVGG